VNWTARPEPIIGEHLSDHPWPVAEKKLLTERERSLYQSLLTLYPDHKLFIQVALSQLVDVDRDHHDREIIRNRYKQLVADFVLCRTDLSVVAVIELDDASHQRADRQYADARKNKALADAGIRLVRIPAGQLPSMEKLRKLLDADRPLSDRTDIPTLHALDPELRLVEEVVDSTVLTPIDHSEAESHVIKQAIMKVVLGAGLVVAGWFIYTQLIGFAAQRAFQTLAVTHTVTASPLKSLTPKPKISAAPVIAGVTAAESSVQRQQESQASNALQTQKNKAWAAFYTAPASCGHPADWSAQVECGNLYMRAKKVFEQRWNLEHSAGQGAGAGVVLDNRSVVGSSK
jgi:hypothetical protein